MGAVTVGIRVDLATSCIVGKPRSTTTNNESMSVSEFVWVGGRQVGVAICEHTHVPALELVVRHAHPSVEHVPVGVRRCVMKTERARAPHRVHAWTYTSTFAPASV